MLIQKILQHAQNSPDRIALVEKNRTITYLELKNLLYQNVNFLKYLGFTSNETILIPATNEIKFTLVYLASHYIGLRSLLYNPNEGKDRIIKIANEINAKEIIEHSSPLPHYYKINRLRMNNKPSQIVDLLLSSGTTGQQKIVPLTNKQLELVLKHMAKNIGNTSNDKEVIVMPLCHSFGLSRLRSILNEGGTAILGESLLKPKNFFEAIQKNAVTGLGLVPAALEYLIRVSGDRISHYSNQIKYIEIGSATLSRERKELLKHWFPNTNIAVHYGLTEVSRAFFTHLQTDNLDAVGKVNDGSSVLILNENKEPVPEGELGEIAIKRPWVIKQYYNNTAPQNYLHKGYFLTGDLGRLEKNYLFLEGRLKEIINVGGKKVIPETIERIINTCSSIKESACTRLKDKEMGEIVQAFIVVDKKNKMKPQDVITDIKKKIKEHLPSYMQPQKYTFIDALKKTTNGKIQRYKLC